MVLSGPRSGGVVMAKFSGHVVTFRSSPTVFADTAMSWVDLDLHPIWPAAKKRLERGNTFRFVSH
jgi:hypothetical protein